MITARVPEREILQRALSECKRRLDYFRARKNYLQADLTESDLNAMLDKLQELNSREKNDTCTD